MNIRSKSQRAFVGVTLTTVLSIAMVLLVYAATLANIPGGEVTVGGVTGNITYSTDNSAGWGPTLTLPITADDWYAKFDTTGGQYVGPVRITWTLFRKGSLSDWTDAANVTTTTTNIVLTSASQTIYATSDGSGPLSNHDWSAEATTTASYRVVVVIQSTG